MATRDNIYESTASAGSGQADGGNTYSFFDSVDPATAASNAAAVERETGT
jgi:hypothetical protein